MYWQKKYFEFIDLNYKIDHIVFLIFMISIHGAFEKMYLKTVAKRGGGSRKEHLLVDGQEIKENKKVK